VEELHLASCGARRGVEADEGAEAHAVHAGDIGQIEHDSFAAWDDGADLGVEDVGQLGDQLPMAMDDDHFVGAFKVEGEAGRSWFVGHRLSLVPNRHWLGMGSRKFLMRQPGCRRKILGRDVKAGED
jgi:hypothetical protein